MDENHGAATNSQRLINDCGRFDNIVWKDLALNDVNEKVRSLHMTLEEVENAYQVEQSKVYLQLICSLLSTLTK